MLNQSIVDALNEHLNKELYSAYLYQSMSAHSAFIGLPGVANWMDVQAKEESAHAMRIYDYINEHGSKVILKAIEQPETKFESLQEMYDKTLAHEQFITKSINNLVSLARKENDYATEIFLSWYVTEQVEEESNVKTILDKIKLIGGTGNGIFMIDNELASRVFNPSPVVK